MISGSAHGLGVYHRAVRRPEQIQFREVSPRFPPELPDLRARYDSL